jgi:hypothetical protein
MTNTEWVIIKTEIEELEYAVNIGLKNENLTDLEMAVLQNMLKSIHTTKGYLSFIKIKK